MLALSGSSEVKIGPRGLKFPIGGLMRAVKKPARTGRGPKNMCGLRAKCGPKKARPIPSLGRLGLPSKMSYDSTNLHVIIFPKWHIIVGLVKV